MDVSQRKWIVCLFMVVSNVCLFAHDAGMRKNVADEDSARCCQVKSRNGGFVISYDESYFMTEGVKRYLRLAADWWEEKISVNRPIRFHVCMSEDMGTDVAIKTTVGYCSDNAGLSVPDNLYCQDADCTVDDTICFNGLLDWDVAWKYDNPYSENFSLFNGVMHSISRILGLGFGNVWEYSLTDVSHPLSLDREMLSALGEIGWNVCATDGEIVCANEVLPGYCSAYDELVFQFRDGQTGETLPVQWEFQIFDNDSKRYKSEAPCKAPLPPGGGSQTLDQNPLTLALRLSTIDNSLPLREGWGGSCGWGGSPSTFDNALDEYNGLQARVVCNYEGKQYCHPLTLETRPWINDVEISNISATDDSHYQFDLSISQKGASDGVILVSDDTGAVREYNQWEETQTVGNLLFDYDVYIDVQLKNRYGEASALLTKNPRKDFDVLAIGQTTAEAGMPVVEIVDGGVRVTSNEECVVEIYSVDGRLCARSNPTRLFEARLDKGVYVVRTKVKGQRILKGGMFRV